MTIDYKNYYYKYKALKYYLKNKQIGGIIVKQLYILFKRNNSKIVGVVNTIFVQWNVKSNILA